MDQRDLIPGQRLTAAEMTLQPRIIEINEPLVLRPTQRPARTPEPVFNTDPVLLLRAAVQLIPHQPTTEQWQTIKQAIMDIKHAA